MEFVASIKGAIAWLSGALAAITALCYGVGYFSYHAQLTMLGLNCQRRSDSRPAGRRKSRPLLMRA